MNHSCRSRRQALILVQRFISANLPLHAPLTTSTTFNFTGSCSFLFHSTLGTLGIFQTSSLILDSHHIIKINWKVHLIFFVPSLSCFCLKPSPFILKFTIFVAKLATRFVIKSFEAKLKTNITILW